jgi:hypothetical protein
MKNRDSRKLKKHEIDLAMYYMRAKAAAKKRDIERRLTEWMYADIVMFP